MEKRLVPIGRVIKLHGIKGKLKLKYFGEDPGQFLRYREVAIEDPTGSFTTYEVQEAIPQPPRIILKLKGIDHPEDAQPLIGREIFIQKEALPDLEEGEYYWADLLGMVVETEGGKKIGTVKEIFSTGAHDVFVVEAKRGDILLPATEEVIRRIDPQRGVIEVQWMEGLWDAEDEV